MNGALTWLLQSLFAVVMLCAGALVYWMFTRLGVIEAKQDTARDVANAVRERVGVVEASVEYLKKENRIRFDLRVDRDLLAEQIEAEVKKQMDA